jgi:hypothetical protein
MRLLIFCLFLCFSCPTFGQSSNNVYAIFTYDSRIKALAPAKFLQSSMSADLNRDEIREIDSLIKQSVNEYNIDANKAYERALKDDAATGKDLYFIVIAEYKIQLVPVINEKKEKEVWVNAFCELPNDWGKRIIDFTTGDGGKCFFRLKINLARKTYSDFETNELG